VPFKIQEGFFMEFHFVDALRYPFSDQRWLSKVGIAFLISLIPILGSMILLGYGIRLIQRLYRREPGLPEWDDFGGDLGRGFMAFLGFLILYAPAILVACIGAIIASADDSGVLNCLVNLLVWGYILLATPFGFSALARYAVTNDFNVFIDIPGRIQDVLSNPAGTIGLYVDIILFYIVWYILVLVGFVACCIPGLLMAAAGSLAINYIIAQWGFSIGAASSGASVMGPPPQQGYSF
jgi:hypothetical protein